MKLGLLVLFLAFALPLLSNIDTAEAGLYGYCGPGGPKGAPAKKDGGVDAACKAHDNCLCGLCCKYFSNKKKYNACLWKKAPAQCRCHKKFLRKAKASKPTKSHVKWIKSIVLSEAKKYVRKYCPN